MKLAMLCYGDTQQCGVRPRPGVEIGVTDSDYMSRRKEHAGQRGEAHLISFSSLRNADVFSHDRHAQHGLRLITGRLLFC